MTSTKINCTFEPLPIYVRCKTKAAAGSLCGIGNKDSNSALMYEMALVGEPAKFVENLRASPFIKIYQMRPLSARSISLDSTFIHITSQNNKVPGKIDNKHVGTGLIILFSQKEGLCKFLSDPGPLGKF